MNRLIENTVFSGFVIACRLATCPTRISPSFVNPATEGVSRLPSWFAITVGLPPSTTATTELVVPRSMPITFAIVDSPFSFVSIATERVRPAPSRHSYGFDRLNDVALDRLGLDLVRLRELHFEDSVAVRRLHLLGLHGHRQLDAALELPVDALDVMDALVLGLTVECALALHGQQVPYDRQGHILLRDTRQLEIQHEIILGLMHVENRCPRPHRRPGRRGSRPSQETVEQAVDLSLYVGHVAKRIPSLNGHERTPTLNRHFLSPPWLCTGLLGPGYIEYISYISSESYTVKSIPVY